MEGKFQAVWLYRELPLILFLGKPLVRWNKGGFVKQDLREALPKVRNPPSFTLRKEKTKEAS